MGLGSFLPYEMRQLLRHRVKPVNTHRIKHDRCLSLEMAPFMQFPTATLSSPHNAHLLLGTETEQRYSYSPLTKKPVGHLLTLIPPFFNF